MQQQGKGVSGHTKMVITSVNKLANINFVQILTTICNITKFRGGQFQIQEVLGNTGYLGLLPMSRTVSCRQSR